MDLIEQFGRLSPSTREGKFLAAPIEGFLSHRIAKDHHGNPFLLVASVDDGATAQPLPVRFEHLRVTYDALCAITRLDGSEEEAVFAVVGCVGGDQVLNEYFLRTIGSLLPALGTMPSRGQLIQSIDRVLELFSLLTRPQQGSVQGLWAELFLIQGGTDPRGLMRAWHEEQTEMFDFGTPSQRLEVKSSSGRLRSHLFRLEQLQAPPGASLVVVSMFVERSAGGPSVAEFVDSIRVRMANEHELVEKLDRLVALTLGDNWREATSQRFDADVALESLRFYPPESVPAVNANVAPAVSEIHFRSDLSGVAPIRRSDLVAKGGLFAAAWPKARRG